MKPTQAQIEAAAWLICPNQIVRCEKLCGDCKVKAKKILTTAAEVVEKESSLDYMLRHSNAAANVTVERCAQVAEWFSNVEKFTAEDVAARIRTLKDIKE